MKVFTSIAAFAFWAISGVAQAGILTYDFSVTATSGPLTGTSANGLFSFDDAVVPAGTNHHATGLLTALDFTWHGIQYTSATANTGAIDRAANGDLTFVMFGNNCFPGTCAVSANAEQWVFRGGQLNDFAYSDTTAIGFGTSTVSLHVASVPEPSTFALFGLGLTGLIFRRGKKA